MITKLLRTDVERSVGVTTATKVYVQTRYRIPTFSSNETYFHEATIEIQYHDVGKFWEQFDVGQPVYMFLSCEDSLHFSGSLHPTERVYVK